MDELRIKITGQLDSSKTKQQLQQQLKEIESKLNVQIGVDTKLIQNISKQVSELQKIISKQSQGIKIIDDQEAIKNINKVKSGTRELFTDIDKAVKAYSKLGTVKVNQNIDPLTKEMKNFTLTVTKADGMVEKLKYDLAHLQTPNGLQKAFELTSIKGVNDVQKITENILQKNQQVKQTIDRQNESLAHQLNLFKQQSAINVKKLTRKYADGDIDKTALDNYLKQVNALDVSTPKLKQQMDNLNMSFKNISESVKTSTSHTLSFGEQLKIAASRTLIWAGATTTLYGSLKLLTSWYDTLTLIDERLISIQKVTNALDMTDTLRQSTESAKEFGRTIDQALESVEEISKLGFGESDAQKLSKNALLLATVGEMGDAEAANYLVAVMRQYKLEVEDVSKVVDSLNELSNRTGSSTIDLAQALSKSSSSAQITGMTFDELAGITAQVVETLKISGNEAGTFIKALNTRILRENTIKDLESFGVAVKDINGDLLSSTDILKNVSDKWDTFDKMTKGAISESLGGAWHANKVAALIEGMDRAMQNATISADSFGSATKELETFQNGLAYKSSVLKASIQELAMSFASAGGRSGVVVLIESFTKIVQAFNDLTVATNGWNVKLPLLVASVYGLGKAFTFLSTVAKGAKLSLGWIGAGVVGLELLATAIAGISKSNQEAIDSFVDSSNKYSDDANRLELLVKKYDELKPKISTSKEAQAEYRDVLSEIGDIAPQVIEATGKYGDTLEINKSKVEDFTKSLRGMSDEQLKNAQVLVSNTLITEQNKLDELTRKQSKRSKEIQEMFDTVQAYNKKYGVSTLSEASDDYLKRLKETGLVGKEARKAADEYAKYNDILNMHSKDLEKYSESMKKVQDQQSKVDGLKEQQNQLKLLTGDYSELNKTIKSTFDNKINTDMVSGFDKNQLSALIQFGKSVKDNQGQLEEYVPILQNAGIKQEKIDEITKALTVSNKDLSSSYEDLEEDMGGVTEEQDKLAKSYNDAISNISSLNGVLNDLNEGHGLSADSIGLILEKYDHLLPYINDEVTLRKKLAEEIEKESKIAKQAILEKLKDNETFYNNVIKANSEFVNKLKSHYGVDLRNYKSLASAKGAVENSLLTSLSKAWSSHYDNVSRSIAAMQMSMNGAFGALTGGGAFGTFSAMSTLKGIQDHTQVTTDFNNIMLDGIDIMTDGKIATNGLSDATKKSTKSKEKDTKATEKSTYVADKYAQSLEKISAALEKQHSIQSKFPEWSQEYRNSLNEELKLLKEKKSVLEAQSKELQNQINTGNVVKYGVSTTKTTTSSSPSSKATGGSTQDIIWNFFKQKGLSDSAVAGIMGNLQLESNFNPSAVNKSSGATGIAQWLGGRLTGLKSYAKSIGTTYTDLNTQLQWLWKELNSTENKTLKYLQSNSGSSASALAAGFERLFERSGGAAVGTRQGYANNIYSKYNGKKVSTTSSSVTDTSREVAENLSSLDDAKSKLVGINTELVKVNDEIDNIEQIKLIESKANDYEHLMDGVDRTIDKIKSQMSLEEEGSVKYNNLLKQQVSHYKYKQTLLHKEAEYLRGQIKSGKLNKRQVDELTQKVSELSLAWWDVENQINSVNQSLKQMREQVADEVIDTLKDALSQQRDMMSAQYDKQLQDLEDAYDKTIETYDKDLEEFEKAHDKKMDLLDDELKKYEDSVNNRIKLMKQLRDEENYDKEVSNRQKEINKIQSKIDEKSLDTSYKGQAEKAKLEEELAKLKEDLSEYQSDREYDLREKNLQDQLEAYQKEVDLQKESLENKLESYQKDIEAKKKAEEEKFKLEQKRIQDEKLANERALNEEIANERKWAKLREEIVSGNLDNVKGLIGNYLTDLQKMNEDTAKSIEISWQNVLNTIDALNKASNSLSDMPLTIQQTIDKMKANSEAWKNASADERKHLEKENQELGSSIGANYNPSTGSWSYGGAPLYSSDQSKKTQDVVNQMKANSAAWSKASASEKKRLEEENKRLGKSIGATYDSAKGIWYKDGIRLYHKGGIVGDKPTNKLAELANKLFNAQPNEQIIKSLKGELQVPPKNIPNGFKNLTNLINSFTPQVLTTDSGITINRMDVRIENIEGGEAGAKSLFKHIDRQMVRRGGRKP